ncbi:MAG: protein kinase [Alphaproteobacteria bacterium]|nr:protein kinase [Alphaproteobacteria bacterium]
MIEPGEVIDNRFQVEALIGEGGLAHVYRVRHLGLGSVHALKLLSWRKKSLAERLIIEGRIQAQLNHPNIVAVTDLVRHDGQLGLLMEYIDNLSLEDHLNEHGGLGLQAGLELFAPILSAVTAAHDAGVTHRDLKPANVLLAASARGLSPKVTDFGIAKVVAEEAGGSTAVGATMGTPGYLAPEQVLDSSTIDMRADIFALGAIAYEMITGVRAFGDENGKLTVGSTSQVIPKPLAVYIATAPAHVQEALARAMAKNPDERYPDCRSFARDLFRDEPRLLLLVEGQQGTGMLSLAGARETLDQSLRSVPSAPPPAAPSEALHSNPTMLDSRDADDDFTESGGGGATWAALGILAVGGFVLAVGAGLVAAVAGHAWLGTDDSAVAVATDPSLPVPRVDPVAPQPSTEPDALDPDALDPDAVDPDGIADPDAVDPDAVDPDAVDPDAVDPDAMDPDAVDPVANPVPAPVPSVGVTQAPAPVAPAPVPDPDDAVAVVEPVQPEPVVQPEPIVQPEPVQPKPDPVVAEPAPAATPPEIGGIWNGRAAKRPFRLELTEGTTGGQVFGNAVFPSPTASRSEKLSGTVSPDGVVRLTAGEFVFTGRLSGITLSGTYEAGGSGKRLDWSVSRGP